MKVYRRFIVIILLLTFILILSCNKSNDVKPTQLELNKKYTYHHLQVGDNSQNLKRFVVVDSSLGSYKEITSTSKFTSKINSIYESQLDESRIDSYYFYNDNKVKLELANFGVVKDSIKINYQYTSPSDYIKIYEIDPENESWLGLNNNALHNASVVFFSRPFKYSPYFSIKLGPILSKSPDFPFYIKSLMKSEKLTKNDTIVIGDFYPLYKLQ